MRTSPRSTSARLVASESSARNLRSGFTLIELLVVIAIIGILSSIVLSSLNGARQKGNDAAVKGDLENARTQAELFYGDNGNAYVTGATGGTGDVCSATGLVNGTKGIYQFVTAAANATGATVNVALATAGSQTSVTCHSTPATAGAYAPLNAWAIEAPLKGTYAGITKPAYCVQSDGFSGVTDISGGSQTKLVNGDARCDQ